MEKTENKIDYVKLLFDLKDDGFDFEKCDPQELGLCIEYSTYESQMERGSPGSLHFQNFTKDGFIQPKFKDCLMNKRVILAEKGYSLSDLKEKYNIVWEKILIKFRNMADHARFSSNAFVSNFFKMALVMSFLDPLSENYPTVQDCIKYGRYIKDNRCAEETFYRIASKSEHFKADSSNLLKEIDKNNNWLHKYEKYKMQEYEQALNNGSLNMISEPVKYFRTINFMFENSDDRKSLYHSIVVSVKVVWPRLIKHDKLIIYNFITNLQNGNFNKHYKDYELKAELVEVHGSKGSKAFLKRYEEASSLPFTNLSDVTFSQTLKERG